MKENLLKIYEFWTSINNCIKICQPKIECQGSMKILPAKLFRKSRYLTRMNSDRICYATVFPRAWKHLKNIGYMVNRGRAHYLTARNYQSSVSFVSWRRGALICQSMFARPSAKTNDVTRVNANCENIFCKCHARENRISFGSRLLETLLKFNLNIANINTRLEKNIQ